MMINELSLAVFILLNIAVMLTKPRDLYYLGLTIASLNNIIFLQMLMKEIQDSLGIAIALVLWLKVVFIPILLRFIYFLIKHLNTAKTQLAVKKLSWRYRLKLGISVHPIGFFGLALLLNCISANQHVELTPQRGYSLQANSLGINSLVVNNADYFSCWMLPSNTVMDNNSHYVLDKSYVLNSCEYIGNDQQRIYGSRYWWVWQLVTGILLLLLFIRLRKHYLVNFQHQEKSPSK